MDKENDRILDLMLEDMRKASELYMPTSFWMHGVQQVVDAIKKHGLSHFRSLESMCMFFVPTYAFPGYFFHKDMKGEFQNTLRRVGVETNRNSLALSQFLDGEMQAFSDYRVFLATITDRYPFCDQISESEVGHPLEHFVFDGKRYSRSLLNYLLGLNFLKLHCDLSGVNTVLEIGGGFGTLGEILLGDERNHCFYIDVDIPPTSYVASYYLQEVFGKDAISTYDLHRGEDELQIDTLRSQFRGAVLCSWQLPRLTGHIDLFVNFISFQEMEPNIVKNYLQQVDRLQAKYLLLRNLREGKQKAKDENSIGVREPIKSEDYDTFLPNYRLIAANTVSFGYKTVDGFHSELKIFERK